MQGSANLNVMMMAARKAGRSLVKDFREVENLQVSMKGAGDFVSAADRKAEEIERMVYSLLDERKHEELHRDRQVDFSFGIDGVGRFRANAFRQRGNLSLALRVVPFRVRTLEELGAPAACTTLLNKPYGIVLVVGPTGSGKSTTLAAMINHINETRSVNIISLEDPIEFVHPSKKSQVIQRELNTHVRSFADGVRSAMR